ncbi:uncharacterized protein LOC121298738 isoform X2 [Polyodon spathula]|uniref:uncharacterized protein LOC121298738 isoform X2 n=1 Tax=Polyodon spathula TaxID=7913 RepID=UPI001B7E153E|nr:uncharacterized protein LOC121298738 isoform X2 [Polyodon spathula]
MHMVWIGIFFFLAVTSQTSSLPTGGTDSEDVKVVAKAGENATLPFGLPKHLQGTPVENLVVKWSSLKQMALCSHQNGSFLCKENVRGRIKMVHLDLVITNVSIRDQGMYYYKVRGGSTTHHVMLVVENSTSTPTSFPTLDNRTTLQPDQTSTAATNTTGYITGAVAGAVAVAVVVVCYMKFFYKEVIL